MTFHFIFYERILDVCLHTPNFFCVSVSHGLAVGSLLAFSGPFLFEPRIIDMWIIGYTLKFHPWWKILVINEGCEAIISAARFDIDYRD